ncbi:MAG: hypothetical protein NXH75_04365 [Halobacteriovoraceae bacterium]|nr:hypothetical protein [Halobacteriovoraceae bacterium]
MNKLIPFIALIGLFLPVKTLAYGTGYVTYPLMPTKRIVSTEFTGIASNGGGIGLQGRFTQKLNEKMIVDAGLGIAGGERDSRFFVGADYELFHDYMKQPRVSMKVTYLNAKEFDVRRNIFTIAPTVSKGFSFWGNEAYPFVSLPIGVNLDGDTKTYESQVNANLGITGNLPFEGYRKLMGTIETTVDVKDSFTAFFVGLSYPLN